LICLTLNQVCTLLKNASIKQPEESLA